MIEPSELNAAIYRRDAQTIERLMAAGVEPTFFEAAALGDGERLTRFLARDATLTGAFSADGFSALHLAAFFGHPEAVRLLLERGADPNARSQNALRLCPINSAAASGNAETVIALLAADVDVDARQERGFTALHEAALNGNVQMIRALLAKGADPNLVCDDGRTAIDFARASKREDAIAALQPD